jgi:flagellar protein FlaG
MVAASPRPAAEKPRTARIDDVRPPRPGNRTLSEVGRNPAVAADELNNHLQQVGSELKLQADSDTGRLVFKVVIPTTGEVLFQVPSEEVLALARNLRAQESVQGASGVLVDTEG